MAAPDGPSGYHLAEFNLALARGGLDEPVMHGFVSRLDEINAIADAAPGFVWRLQTDEGNATAVRAYDDERILINLSVWESLEAFEAYVYRSEHGFMVRHGNDWFERPAEPQVAMWWIRAGTLPSVPDGVARLDHLREHGPSPHAFDFKTRFPPPSAAATRGD